jgi:hypothetical protein
MENILLKQARNTDKRLNWLWSQILLAF